MYDEFPLGVKFRGYYHVRPNEAGHFAIKKKRGSLARMNRGEKTRMLSRGVEKG